MTDGGSSSWAMSGAVLFGIYMLAVGSLTFVVYARDKSAAERGLWRVRENTLHWWSLLGGWPGAYLAQRAFRHKTRKEAFQARYRLTVVFNCAVLAFLALCFSGFGRNAWPVAAELAGMVSGSPWPGWPAAAGALAGAASMFVVRVPVNGRICLALLAGGAVAVTAILGFHGAGVLAERAVAAAGRYPACLAGIVAGQCAAALLGLVPGKAAQRKREVERMSGKASFPRVPRERNPVARVLRGRARFRRQVAANGKRYLRRAKHPGRAAAEDA